MKKLILLLALSAFTYTASAAEVHIRKDTEVCKFSKRGKVVCSRKKHKSHYHKLKQKRKAVHLRHKHRSKYHRCKL